MRRLAVIALLLAACGKPNPQKDLPNEKVTLNEDQRIVYVSPDRFPNVLVWCDGTTRIYATTRDAHPLDVVPNSPECKDGGS